MNFREIDFHIHLGHEIEASRLREHRLRINHIIDSIFLRIPKGLSTELFSKLNVKVSNFKTRHKFWHMDRIGHVEYFDLDADHLFSLPQQESVELVRSYFLRGISVAAKYDLKFATHLPCIRQLIKTSHLPYDYRTGVSCALRGKRMKAELILRIQPIHYLWDVKMSGDEGIERLTLNRTEPSFPYFTGFKNLKLRWSDNRILLIDRTGTVLVEHGSK
jgi:hypothetical protein